MLSMHLLFLTVWLFVQAQKKRRETWAGGALSSLSQETGEDDMAQGLMPLRAHNSRHTGSVK